MLTLEPEQIERELVSSFPSLFRTVVHNWSAEFMWWQRLTLVEHPVWVQGDFSGTFPEACANWKDASAKLVAFVEKQFDDRAFTHVLQYYDLKKNSHKTPVNHVLLHVFNHSASHRGQLITMLREVGVKKIPQTDFIVYCRNTAK